MVDAIYVMFIERAMKREKKVFADRKRRLLRDSPTLHFIQEDLIHTDFYL